MDAIVTEWKKLGGVSKSEGRERYLRMLESHYHHQMTTFDVVYCNREDDLLIGNPFDPSATKQGSNKKKYPQQCQVAITPESVRIIDRKSGKELKKIPLWRIKNWGVSPIYFVINAVEGEVQMENIVKDYFYTLQGTQIDYLMTTYVHMKVNKLGPLQKYQRKFTPNG